MNRNRKALLLGPAGFAMLALLPVAGIAQLPVDSRWLPWLGCWQPVAEQDSPPGDLAVCVRAGESSNAVEVSTFKSGEIASSRALVADGQPHPVQDQGCAGSQFAQFSSDARRVYLWSTLSCEGGLKRTASAIMALASPGEWLDAQALGVNGKRASRVMRYQPAPDAQWPAGFALDAQRTEAVADARVAASGRLSLADVREAASSVDQEALTALVLELDRPFDLDGAKLASLADAGVPADVIDAVVAVSYPTRFAIDRGAVSLAAAPAPAPEAESRYGRPIYPDPYGWGWWGMDECSGGWGYWSAYCGSSLYWASGLGFGGYLPYWYNPYGYGYGYGYQPIIVVPGSGEPAHGTLVRGRGVTRGGQPAGGTGGYAHPRGSATQDRRGGDRAPSAAPSGPRAPAAGTQGGVSPSGATRSPSSSGGGSRGTAKPKCCS